MKRGEKRGSDLNDSQIAFIICSNSIQYYNECVRYIQDLRIPEGYETDIICVQEAESMAQGYNAGMRASEAKYKIYLHQDTFIINKDFIYEILKIFGDDERIGMVGVLGATELPEDADLCFKWNAGHIEAYTGMTTIHGSGSQDRYRATIEVKAIDGLMMVTQYDVPWREDLLDGWDFYDVSQSLEMHKCGYKVVVPNQEMPWCYHDCGVSKMGSYDFYRTKIIAAYPEEFSGCIYEQQVEKKKKVLEETEKIREGLIRLMDLKAYVEVEELISRLDLEKFSDTQIFEIACLMEINALERDSINNTKSEWYACENWNHLRTYYTWVRFVLLRAGYGREDERIGELREKIIQGKVSYDAIRKIAASVLKDTAYIHGLFLNKIEKEPLVSVILYVFNGESVVKQTIESIVAQSYKNMEIIIFDDCSTDRSKEIVLRFAKEDMRIRTFFSDTRREIWQGENICAELAQGRYIAVIRQGDVWLKNKLEKQILFLEEHPSYGICFTWVDIFGEMKRTKWYQLYERFFSMNNKNNEWIRMLFYGKNPFCTSSACIRKDIFISAGTYYNRLVCLYDEYFWLKALSETSAYIIQEKLTWYREMGYGKGGEQLDLISSRRYELQWIREKMITEMSLSRFVQIFKRDMQDKNALEEKEILCEKILLLHKLGSDLEGEVISGLMADKECRELLKTKYKFSL
jgi:Glycosyltransferases involved in cell wall biogenesis